MPYFEQEVVCLQKKGWDAVTQGTLDNGTDDQSLEVKNCGRRKSSSHLTVPLLSARAWAGIPLLFSCHNITIFRWKPNASSMKMNTGT